MIFVFSFWIIVALILAMGVAACLIVFFKMDKKDSVLIKEFVESQTQEETTTESAVDKQ